MLTFKPIQHINFMKITVRYSTFFKPIKGAMCIVAYSPRYVAEAASRASSSPLSSS